MKKMSPVLRQFLSVALGEVFCVALMIGVYALIGKYSTKVLLGALVGGVLAVVNFFLLTVGVSNAADKAENGDPKGAQNFITLSYIGRMAVLALVLFGAGKSGRFDLLALVLPLVFPRPVISICEFFRKLGEKRGT